ncbi:hypothetical protein [Treponema phagedenis]|uniref:hypothetical protein n=1 Tax=Treponema phagedenis TaxID=162 RepID=UPI0001F63CFF|nr:hypothetical protein [Treponema phagedenis]EFW37553.1 hypothetical protein HMPREF9554_01945 [Treponema phagedenis F0421]TYT79246.1 hypothetical protein FS559_09125 [Treponema phagedenis]
MFQYLILFLFLGIEGFAIFVLAAGMGLYFGFMRKLPQPKFSSELRPDFTAVKKTKILTVYITDFPAKIENKAENAALIVPTQKQSDFRSFGLKTALRMPEVLASLQKTSRCTSFNFIVGNTGIISLAEFLETSKTEFPIARISVIEDFPDIGAEYKEALQKLLRIQFFWKPVYAVSVLVNTITGGANFRKLRTLREKAKSWDSA